MTFVAWGVPAHCFHLKERPNHNKSANLHATVQPHHVICLKHLCRTLCVWILLCFSCFVLFLDLKVGINDVFWIIHGAEVRQSVSDNHSWMDVDNTRGFQKKKSAGYFSQHAHMKKKEKKKKPCISFAEKFLTSTVQECSLRPNCLQT